MIVLLFHKLTRAPEFGISWHTPRQFEIIICKIKELGFVNGSFQELINLEYSSPSGRGGEKGRKLLVTFDDGYSGVYEYGLPILKKYGFTALIFLIAGYLGKKSLWDMNILQRFRHLDWDEILELQKVGFEFGSHTMTHPDLTFVSPRRLEWELKESKMVLEERLGTIECLSYPFGRYNSEIKKGAKQAGYKLAFAIYPRQEDNLFNPLAVKRTPVHFLDPWWLLKAELLHPDSFLGRTGENTGKLVNFLARGTTLMRKKDYKDEISIKFRGNLT